MFGANRNPYQQPGEWNISIAARNLVSNDHYNGKEEQVRRQEVGSFVTNRQNLLDIGISRVMTKRLTLSVGIPFVNSSWASRDPISPFPGPRKEIEQNGRGLGDISVMSRFWVFDPDTHLDWNVTAGLGLKTPTGNEAAQDSFPGNNPVTAPNRPRYVDSSVQPGDGGWGIIAEAHLFHLIKRGVLFGSGTYLANPRNTNGTPSLSVSRLPDGQAPSANSFDKLVNSVPDQYFARLGGTVALWKGFSASLAWRLEGLKRYDLFGDSNGHRRPGTAMFWEPGIAYAHGRQQITFNVPLGYYYNRHPDPNTGFAGDATFPRHIFLTSYSYRIGRTAPAASDQPPAPAAPSPLPGQQSNSPSDGQTPATAAPSSTSTGNQVGQFWEAPPSGVILSAGLQAFGAPIASTCAPVSTLQ